MKVALAESLKNKDQFEKVKMLDFFCGFPDSEIWEIIRAGVWIEADVDETIVVEGDVEDSSYIIISGDVAVLKQGTHVGCLGKGDCFGEMGYLSRIKRTATVTAQGPVSLLRVNATLIEQVTSDCQLRFYKVFMKILIERFSITTNLMVQASRDDPKQSF